MFGRTIRARSTQPRLQPAEYDAERAALAAPSRNPNTGGQISNRHWRAAAILVIVAPFLIAFPGTAQANPSCGPPYDFSGYAQAYAYWVPGDNTTGGVRAPVQARRDGRECDNGSGSWDYGALVWISIENQALDKLTQVGFIREYDHHAGHDEVRFCKWEQIYPDETGGNPYDCSTVDNDIFVYFKVNRVSGGYRIFDCGTSDPDYSSCGNPIDSRSTTYSNDEVVEAAENNTGDCYVEIMGSSGDADNIGTSTYPAEIQDDAGPWTKRTMSGAHNSAGTVCQESDGTYDYQIHIQDQGVVSFYDDRNTS